MGMFGWDDPKQAATYTKKARQSKLARASMHLLARVNRTKKSAKCPTVETQCPTATKSVGQSVVWHAADKDGAPGRTRTNTSVRKPDFESGASTNSATGAQLGAPGIKPRTGTRSTHHAPSPI